MSDIHQRVLALEEQLAHLKAQLARERAWIRQVIPSEKMVTAGAEVIARDWPNYPTRETVRRAYLAMVEAAEISINE